VELVSALLPGVNFLSDLKILSSHPVQYHVPFFRAMIAEGIDIAVGYYHQGTAGRIGHDDEFGMDFEWDIDLLDGYPHRMFIEGRAKYHWLEQIKVAPRLLSWALQDRQTPLLLMGWFNELIWLIWLLRIFSQAPTIAMSETTPLSFAATTKPRWRVSLLRWLLQHTTAILFIGSRNRAFLSEMGVSEERLFHVPYSIDNARFSAEANRLMPERHMLCHHYGLDSELPTFLFCGKLIHKKRPLQLLEAYLAADLADRAQLLYVGEGELRPELKHRIQVLGLKHVHVLGFLNQTEMPLAYALGELLCLISEPAETWGLVVNEALACGRPVIISEMVGCSVDLVGIENGWVIPFDNHDKLTQTLLNAFRNYADWPCMGEQGREKVAGYTFTSMAKGAKAALSAFREIST
jgi:glycosyltransferase involved in cell wall biosynthesis